MSGIANPKSPSAVPDDILRTLRRLIRRSRLVVFVRGCFAVAAVALGTILAAMGVDAGMTFFAAWPRWVLSLSALGATLLAALWFLVRPLGRSFTLAGVARAIEARHPELQERVSSAVELLASKDAPELRGSSDLIAALAGEACRDAKGVRPRREVTLRSARPFVWTATAFAAVLGGVFLLWPQQAGHVWARVVAPYENLPNVLGRQLTVRPGDAVIAVGDELAVEVEVANKAVTSAELNRFAPDGRELPARMTPLPIREAGRPRFAFSFPPADQSFHYRLRAGDALSRTYSVTVVPKPAVERFHVAYDYPAYTGRGHQDQGEGEGDIRAVAGTLVEVRATTSTPVDSAVLRVNGQAFAEANVVPAETKSVCTFRFELPRKLQGRWSIDMVRSMGEHRFAASTEARPIEAVADAPPIVKVLSPEDTSLKLQPTDRLPILFAAGDDFGISRAEMLVEVDGHALPSAPLSFTQEANGPLRLVQGKAALDLAESAPPGTGLVTFRLHVLDNLPASLGGPQEAFSPACAIRLDVAAVSYVRQVVLAEEVAVRDVLLAVLAHLKNSKADSLPLRKELEAQSDPNNPAAQAVLSPDSAQRADRIAKYLGAADAAIREVLPRLAEGEFVAMGQKLAALADDHIARARDLAGQIRLSDRPAQRGDLADEADFQIDRSIAIVNDLLKELHVLSEVAQRAQEAAELAQRQEELAGELKEMQKPKGDTPPTGSPTSVPASAPAAGQQPTASPAAAPSTPQQWQKEEQALAGRVAEMVRQSTRAMQQEMARGGEQLKNLSAEARKLAAQQTALAEMTRRAGEAPRLQKEARDLATTQAALAGETAKLAPQEAAPMTAAAEALKAGQNAAALAKQQEAIAALAQRADTITRQALTAELAKKAEQIAAQQQVLAKQAADAQTASQTAASKAKAATTQAAQATGEQQAATSKLSGDLAKLQQRQQELAARSAKVEAAVAAAATAPPAPASPKPAASPTPASGPAAAPAAPAAPTATATPVVATTPAPAPSAAMTAAAKNMTPAKLAEAQAAVKEAIKSADRQAAQLAEQAKAPAPAADPNAGAAPGAPAPSAAAPAGAPPAAPQTPAQAKARSEEAAQIAAQQKKIEQDLAPLALAAAAAQQAATKAQQAQGEAARQTQAAVDANEGLAKLAKPQTDLLQQAGELTKAAPSALPAARDAINRQDPKPAMQQAAAAMQAKTPPQAAQLAGGAAQTAAGLAKALRDAAGAQAPPAAPDAPAKLAELVKAQTQLRQQVAEKTQQAQASAEALRAEQWAALKAQQAQVAADTAAMSDRVKGLAPQEDRLDTKAARSTSDTAQQFASAQDANGRLQAARSSSQSAGMLTDLARRLGADLPPAPADANQPAAADRSSAAAPRTPQPASPASPGEAPQTDEAKREALTRNAADLAQRQQAIASQAQAIAEGRVLDAMRPAQQRLLGQTSDLADDVGLLRTFADQLIPDASARQDANRAASALEQAAQAQDKAQASLAARAAQPAEAQQRKSAAELGAAADSLDQLGRKMADLARSNPAESPNEESQELADSLDAANQAARSEQARDADLAAKLLGQLAKTAAQQAQALGLAAPNGEDPDQPGNKPSQNSKSLRGVGLLPVEVLSGQLQSSGLTITEWGKLPGELRNEILQGAADEGPEEYRALIKRYFEEVARRGAAGSGDSHK